MNKSVSALVVLSLFAAGCSTDFWGGGAAGAGAGVVGTGAAYELKARQQMARLEEEFKAGRMNRQEYDIRKDQIENGSLIY